MQIAAAVDPTRQMPDQKNVQAPEQRKVAQVVNGAVQQKYCDTHTHQEREERQVVARPTTGEHHVQERKQQVELELNGYRPKLPPEFAVRQARQVRERKRRNQKVNRRRGRTRVRSCEIPQRQHYDEQRIDAQGAVEIKSQCAQFLILAEIGG